MQLFALVSLVLAAIITAAPTAIVTGSNPGSIFRFGNPAPARQIFYTSGSCGLSTYFVGKVPSSLPLVAMPIGVMKKYGASQHNTLCAKTITMTVNGVTRTAAIADTNTSSENSIDMTLDLWQAFGHKDNDGTLIPTVKWSIK